MPADGGAPWLRRTAAAPPLRPPDGSHQGQGHVRQRSEGRRCCRRCCQTWTCTHLSAPLSLSETFGRFRKVFSQHGKVGRLGLSALQCRRPLSSSICEANGAISRKAPEVISGDEGGIYCRPTAADTSTLTCFRCPCLLRVVCKF